MAEDQPAAPLRRPLLGGPQQDEPPQKLPRRASAALAEDAGSLVVESLGGGIDLVRFRAASRWHSALTHRALLEYLLERAVGPEGVCGCSRGSPGAMLALGRIAPRGDADALDAALDSLEDAEEEMRVAAVGAVARLASGGHLGAAATAISTRLGDDDEDVRAAAAGALGRLAEVCPEARAHAIVSVEPQMRHPDWWVRSAALGAMAKVAPKGVPAVVLVVAGHSADPAAGPRAAAVSALAELAERGDLAAAAAVARCLGDKEAQVRQAAVAATGRLAAGSDGAAAKRVAACMHDDAEAVRRAAVFALGELAERGGAAAAASAAAALREALCDAEPHVRLPAAMVLRRLAALAAPGCARPACAGG